MRTATLVYGLIFLCGTSPDLLAQDYPSRPIRLIVATAAGGSSDFFGRMIAQKLREKFGQPVVVENRPGFGQMIGADQVAKSVPDGYTITVLGSTYTTSAAVQPKLPFDPVNDLIGVGMLGEGPFMLVVHPSLPAKSVKELIALSRARPGQLNYGSGGSGSVTHLVTAVLGDAAKINITHVPYKSGAPAVVDLAGGHIQMLIGSMPLVWQQTKAGRLRAIAVTTSKRSVFVPELPTLDEAGVPGFSATQWWAVFAPAKVQKNILTQLNTEINVILKTDEAKSLLAAEGAEPTFTTVDGFTNLVRAEILNWRKTIQRLKIKIE